MIVLPDTSVWIEFLKQNQPYSDVVADWLSSDSIIGFEPVFGELLQGCRDERDVRIVTRLWEAIPHVELSSLWIEAGKRSFHSKCTQSGIGLIDVAIWCAAETVKARIATLDKKLVSILPKERYIGIS